jgi:hypothetical protein
LLWAQSLTRAANADPTYPHPLFTGEPFTATLNHPEFLNTTPINIGGEDTEWTTIISDTFENGLDGDIWTSLDESTTDGGNYKWEARVYTPTATSGDISVWSIGGGANGILLDPATGGYPTNLDTWLILGPLNMRNVSEAELTFTYWLEAEAGDPFAVSVSTDGVNYDGEETVNGSLGGHVTRMLTLEDYVGQSNVYIAFTFRSDAAPTNGAKKGAFLDDVSLRTRGLNTNFMPIIRRDPTPTPLPPTPTPVPQDYNEQFNNSNSGWAMRRTDIQDTSDWEIQYATVSNQSVLKMEIDSAFDYLLASPLVPAPAAPYTIDMRAKFDNPLDKHAYGIVFGGDWNGQPCPANNFTSCFNAYYWLNVRWRQNGGANKLEMRLVRVTNHSASNAPVVEVLYDWVNPDDFPGVDVNPNDWTTISVGIETDNDIDILVNGDLVKEVSDDDLLANLANNPYFGIMVNVDDAGTVDALIDSYTVVVD